MVLMQVLRGHTDIVVSLAVSRHSLFSGSTDKTIRVWDLSRLDVTTPSGTRLLALLSLCLLEQYTKIPLCCML